MVRVTLIVSSGGIKMCGIAKYWEEEPKIVGMTKG